MPADNSSSTSFSSSSSSSKTPAAVTVSGLAEDLGCDRGVINHYVRTLGLRFIHVLRGCRRHLSCLSHEDATLITKAYLAAESAAARFAPLPHHLPLPLHQEAAPLTHTPTLTHTHPPDPSPNTPPAPSPEPEATCNSSRPKGDGSTAIGGTKPATRNSPADAGWGHFYLIQLEPRQDPGRYKLGFSTNVEERLNTFRTAAPYAFCVAQWPAHRTWERTAIAAVTQGSHCVRHEVFNTADLHAVRAAADHLFAFLPKSPFATTPSAAPFDPPEPPAPPHSSPPPPPPGPPDSPPLSPRVPNLMPTPARDQANSHERPGSGDLQVADHPRPPQAASARCDSSHFFHAAHAIQKDSTTQPTTRPGVLFSRILPKIAAHPMLSAAFLLLSLSSGWAADPAPATPKPKATPNYVAQLSAKLEPAQRVGYKKVGDRELHLDIFQPAGWKANDRRACFVAFHGGGWTSGAPRVMYRHAAHCAELGMVGISVEYRLYKPGSEVTVFECVKDARSALRYVRAHAAELGIDPQKIVANGASAGGHLAAATALFEGVNDASDDTKVSASPNALILFSPVIDTSAEGYGHAKVGEHWEDLSPAHRVRAGLPPTILFHGTADTTTPFKGAQKFHDAMLAAGNRSELVAVEGAQHTYMFKDKALYESTLQKMDAFLRSLGYLAAAGK